MRIVSLSDHFPSDVLTTIRTPRTQHVSTGLSNGSSSTQPPNEAAHPPPSNRELISITRDYERLNINAVPEISSSDRNYAHQPTQQGSTGFEPSGKSYIFLPI